MKSQGLPLNFIVIAALAILILVLAAGFVIMGGKSIQKSFSPQQARSNCKTICYHMQMDASTHSYSDDNSVSGLDGYTAWCAGQDIEGMGKNINCPNVGEVCYVEFNNSVQKIVGC